MSMGKTPKICRGSVADFEAWAINEVRSKHSSIRLFGTNEEHRTFEELFQKAKFVNSESDGTVVYWTQSWFSSKAV